MTIGSLGIGRDITERRRLESELLEISDREQQRIGHDLHDGLGQQLTGLEMQSFSLMEDLAAHDRETSILPRKWHGVLCALRPLNWTGALAAAATMNIKEPETPD